jgi:hypothetical protein
MVWRVFWFRKPAVAELEAPETDADRQAAAEAEAHAALVALRVASDAAAVCESEHPNRPVNYRNGPVSRIQTPKPSPIQQSLNRAEREALARFYEASRRVAMLKNPGLIL